MVRACCVPGCSTGKTAPSYKFPRNAERRLQWYKNLKMEPVEGPEENRLRVCYNHFKDSDYTCSFKLRVLLSDAVPSINVPSNDETCHLMQDNVETASDVAQEMQEGTGKTYINAQLDELKAEQQRFAEIALQHNETLLLHEETLLRQQEHIAHILENQEENKVDKLMELIQQKNWSRPDLQEHKRKNALSRTGRRLYESIVKLKRDKRRLKRLCNKYKQASQKKTVCLRSTKRRNRVDNSAKIRQQFVNMIIKNNNVAPQVKL